MHSPPGTDLNFFPAIFYCFHHLLIYNCSVRNCSLGFGYSALFCTLSSAIPRPHKVPLMVRDIRNQERNLLQRWDSNEEDEEELKELITSSPVSNNHMQMCSVFECVTDTAKTLLISYVLWPPSHFRFKLQIIFEYLSIPGQK